MGRKYSPASTLLEFKGRSLYRNTVLGELYTTEVVCEAVKAFYVQYINSLYLYFIESQRANVPLEQSILGTGFLVSSVIVTY